MGMDWKPRYRAEVESATGRAALFAALARWRGGDGAILGQPPPCVVASALACLDRGGAEQARP